MGMLFDFFLISYYVISYRIGGRERMMLTVMSL